MHNFCVKLDKRVLGVKMLIKFSVKNFKSIKEEQILDLSADSRDKTNIQEKAFSSEKKFIPPILKSAAIFGANASGKSNVVSAIQTMRDIVIGSPRVKNSGGFQIKPFMLSDNSVNEPTSFCIVVLIDNIVYDYSFSINKKIVEDERLYVYESSYSRRLFERTYDSSKKEYNYKTSSYFKGQKKVYIDTTRPDVLLLSNAVALNNEQLKPLFMWFVNGLIILNEQEVPNNNLIVQYNKSPEYKKELLKFLESADISISDFHIRKTEAVSLFNSFPIIQPIFIHKAKQGSAEFNWNEESLGTRKILQLSGPMLVVFSKPVTLIVDELENSLHPSIVEFIVRQFYNSSKKQQMSQLVFTTHCESLLCNISNRKNTEENSLFRRDQIWFVNKTKEQSSSLVPLSAYKPRKQESVFDGYRKGRYSGIPIISEYVPKQRIDIDINNFSENL